MRYAIILPEGIVTWHTADLPPEPPYGTLREIIAPVIADWFEHVTVLWQSQRADMFVDENGHAKNLPYNAFATGVYATASLGKREISPIVGPAILFEGLVWF